MGCEVLLNVSGDDGGGGVEYIGDGYKNLWWFMSFEITVIGVLDHGNNNNGRCCG